MHKRLLNTGLMAIAVGLVISGATVAYPTKPITLVVPFPPGGSTDIVGRVVADGLSKELGQPVVIENRGGAGGTVGTAVVAKAAPDGHTLAIGTTSTHAVGPATLQGRVRPGEGICADHTGGGDALCARRQQQRAGQVGVGAGRAGEVAAGQVQLWLGGRRQHDASRGRDVRACSRAEDGAHRL